jgi:hypothetical protein
MLCCDMPADTKTVMIIWSFKQKRYPDGTLNKHKAKQCALQQSQTAKPTSYIYPAMS